MRILVLNERDPEHPRTGGAETHVFEISRRLADRGHEVRWIVSRFPGASPRTTLDGVKVERRGRGPLHYLSAVAAVRRESAASCDVIVECLNKLPYFSARAAAVPVVGLCHHLFGATAFDQVSWPVAAGVWLLERGIPWAFRDRPWIAISESTRDDLVARGIPAETIEVQTPGIDRPRVDVAPIVEREPWVVYVGRLEPYKRVEVVLEVAARLRERIPQLRVAIVGRGSNEPALRRKSASLDLEDRVTFTGFVADRERDRWLGRARVCVCPSKKEGFGLTVIEANALGTPNVVADAPGLRDSVRDGETGFRVPVDDVDAFTTRIGALLEDDALARRMSETARAWSDRFDWDTCAASFERTLARAATATGTRGR